MPLARSGPMRFSAHRPSSMAVVGLHGRDHPQLAEALDVLRPQVLRVFDAEAPVACAIAQSLFVHVENDVVGLVADGVYGYLQPRLVWP